MGQEGVHLIKKIVKIYGIQSVVSVSILYWTYFNLSFVIETVESILNILVN